MVLDNVKNDKANVALVGKKKDPLFVMLIGEVCVMKTSQIDNPIIWHARLGHVHENVICQGCRFGKLYCLPFKSLSSHKLTLFELIHTNLMRSAKIANYNY